MIEHLEGIIVLRLPIELRQLGKILGKILGKVIIDHNSLIDLPMFGIGNTNASILHICKIEFTINPETSSVLLELHISPAYLSASLL